VAGFLATVTFHQIGIWILHTVGFISFTPWNMAPRPPIALPLGVGGIPFTLAIPSVLSLAFWGGVWGILFVLIERWLARFPGGYWVGATVFGAIVPTLVLMFVVFPLRGQPVGAGFAMNLVLTFVLVHGLRGLGTAVFLGVLTGWRNQPS
jgi:hypothetical protein